MSSKALALALCGVAMLGGCGGGFAGVGREPDAYLGCATDELWSRFNDVADVVSDTTAPVLTMPAAGTTMLPGTPPRFDWKVSADISGETTGDVPSSCEQWNPGLLPMHLPPISGTAYDLQLVVGGQAQRRIITTMQAWQPRDEDWAPVKGKMVEVRLRRIVVLQNDRKEGPYAPTSNPSFTVGAM